MHSVMEVVMRVSLFALALLLCTATAASGQQASPTAQAGGGSGGIGPAVEREVKALSAEDYAERQAALKRLETLIGEQVKQRAQIQAMIDSLYNDLAQQQQALAMISDEEGKARIAGLLEMERGLAGWTVQTMGESLERRKQLLDWGLKGEQAPILARVYSNARQTRVEGIRQLMKLDETAGDGGSSWTLARLINDPDSAIRASAMAAAWHAKPQKDIVAALWHRAISGPLELAEGGHKRLPMGLDEDSSNLKIDFPEGDPIEFSLDDDAGEYTDALLAANVLVHWNSPLVEERIRRMVEERMKKGKTLAVEEDMDLTLATHWLMETYTIKEAVPVLVTEALAADAQDMGGNMNGQPFMYSQRTMAIGVLCKLIGKDPGDFQLIRARDTGELRGWMWAIDQNPQAAMARGGSPDAAAVRAFYKWWKDHHAEYGVKEDPPASGLPPEPRAGRGRGRGVPMPVENGPEAEK